MYYVGLSVKKLFHDNELNSIHNMNSVGINVEQQMEIVYEMEAFTLLESCHSIGSSYAS